MSGFLPQILAALVLLGVFYLALAVALGLREKKHGRCCCSSSPDGKGRAGGCCKDTGVTSPER